MANEINELMNKLLNGELHAAHLYWQCAAWCSERKLEGGSDFLIDHATEELTHMARIQTYMMDNDIPIQFSALPQPTVEGETVLELFEQILQHEQKVTDSVGQAVQQVQQLGDHATFEFLQWFVLEQRLEMKTFRGIVDRIQLIGDGPQALYMVDRELAERAVAPSNDPTASSGTAA
ncbi:MAG: ferritin [Pseudomonadota bacterium]